MKPQIRISRILLLLLSIAVTLNCSKDESNFEPIGSDPCKSDPCSNPELCADSCNDNAGGITGELNREDLKPEGNVTETENGYMVEGKLSMETESGETVVFNEADLDVEFNEDGSLMSISGTAEVPSPSNYFEIADPVSADVGFFSGKFLNENRNFEIKLKDDRHYFVFAIAVALEVSVGANDDPDATKPITIAVPVGGHITLIQDFTDPMFFYSLGGSALGNNSGDGNNNGDGNNGDGNNDGNGNNEDDGEVMGVSFGASYGANLVYEPSLPVENIVSFDAKSVTGGTFSFWKVLEASGLYYQNKGFSVDFNLKEPMNSEIGYGYRAGINGNINFSADIKGIISFGFPIGKGSTAIVAEASSKEGIKAQAFVNGLVEPDLSWWPDFIPVKPNGNLNAYGYVEETGAFDLGLSGSLGLEMPTGNQGVQGSLRLTQNEFTMTGEVVSGDDVWGATAIITKDETRCIATAPNNFTDGISETVTAQIDQAIETTEKALEDLEKANENYEFELSLRGLRTALPGIIDRALAEINTAEDNGIKSGRSQANKILNDNNRKLCSDNIAAVVKSAVKPYKDALTRLKNAVNNSNDNAQTRTELEAALRNLAGLNKINKSVTVSITHGHKTFGCGNLWKQTNKRTIKINRTILNSTQVSQLNEAADNVKYIQEADGIRFDAQLIVDELPTMEELEGLKKNVEACVSELTEQLGDVGFVYNHETKEYTHFMVINGEEKEVGTFDIFNNSEIVASARLELGSCNTSEELKALQQRAKARR
ncbi:hypothetical protein [Poritiphilus flavus]|uniref:Uncharacterized protein n=1 Tax=Poritiphilus flavus TaxID=2697053 RepID=A0A6L9EBT8_9FLAO|nr:hypothetical protein [Poritiphilus flavus]NAS12008.1 hypothetical protein [Poritiphilus flavus]